MTKIIKLPYGISNYEKLVKEGYYFFDTTQFIEKLENYLKAYVAFLRPRKFGKSLFISMLEYYYDIRHQDKYKELFGKYYIGTHKTVNANKYMVLTLDFSGVNTDTHESTIIGFNDSIYLQLSGFLINNNILDKNNLEEFKSLKTADKYMQYIIERVKGKIFILIDEYDHFANEILAFRYPDFVNSVGRNGFLRKFFEVIKAGTRDGIVDRIFITGVSPITLDSLTSGFNISANLTLEKDFHDMLGFQEKQIMGLLDEIEDICPKMDKNELINTLRKYYNGYLFNKNCKNRLYNPNMTLYYLFDYIRNCKGPEDLLDENIMSDYGKIKQMISIGDFNKNIEIIKEIIGNKEIQSELIKKFSMEGEEFTKSKLISLLFYLGILTIKSGLGEDYIFQMPNYIIQSLYLKYFDSIVTKESQINYQIEDKKAALMNLIFKNDIKGVLNIISDTIKGLSNRNFIGINEKTVQLLIYTYLNLTGMYYIASEYEIEGKFIDIIMKIREPYQAPNQFIFEIKYLKKSEKKNFKKVKEEGLKQLQEYLQLEEIKKMQGVKGYLIVFIGEKYECYIG